jgi:hypothetical protein
MTPSRSVVERHASELAQFTVAPPQHFLYFFPEPQGHIPFRPTLGAKKLPQAGAPMQKKSRPRETGRQIILRAMVASEPWVLVFPTF